jgi:hypothetical protein
MLADCRLVEIDEVETIRSLCSGCERQDRTLEILARGRLTSPERQRVAGRSKVSSYSIGRNLSAV